MDIEYEKVIGFCILCSCVGHSITACKKKDQQLGKPHEPEHKQVTQDKYILLGKKNVNVVEGTTTNVIDTIILKEKMVDPILVETVTPYFPTWQIIK